MASPIRRSTRDLIADIRSTGPNFKFFQAVRLLALSTPIAENPRAPIPKRLRFNTPLSLAFPASEILQVAAPTEQPARSLTTQAPDARDALPQATLEAPEHLANDDDPLALNVTVGFMGLVGPSGALPTAYTELLIERKHQYRDTAAHEFLDIYTHRAISLFYQAWRKPRFYLGYEAGEFDRFSRNLLDFIGVGLGNLQKHARKPQAELPAAFLIHYAGLLSQKPVSATNIAALINGFFQVPAVLEQFVGQWMHIPVEEQSQLGHSGMILGQTACVGARTWDRQTKMRVVLGPLSREQYNDFLPGNPGASTLTELVKFCVGHSLAVDLQLILDKREIPPSRLHTHAEDAAIQQQSSSNQTATAPLCLGYNLWLASRPPAQHANEAQFSLLA